MISDASSATKMVRRSDVIKIVQKEIALQWEICETQSQNGDRIGVLHTRSRIDALRIVRDYLHRAKVFVSRDHAPDTPIPTGDEFAERVRIAGNAVDAPNEADPAMYRLLSDLHVPLVELQAADAEEDIAA